METFLLFREVHFPAQSPLLYKSLLFHSSSFASQCSAQTMAISGSDAQSLATKHTPQVPPLEVESVKCDSCGFTEDCTPAYIFRVRERYRGHWLCGLCAEAVKDEVLRSDRLISTEEALHRHISFCKEFRSSSPPSETQNPISVMGRILKRSLDSPRALRSNSSIILPDIDRVKGSSLVRSESCFSSLSR